MANESEDKVVPKFIIKGMMLNTGVTIVTIFQPSMLSPFHYTCIKPKRVEMICDSEGLIESFAILEFMPFAGTDVVLINKQSVTCISDPEDDVIQAYQLYISETEGDPALRLGDVVDVDLMNEIAEYLNAEEDDDAPEEEQYKFPHSGSWAGEDA